MTRSSRLLSTVVAALLLGLATLAAPGSAVAQSAAAGCQSAQRIEGPFRTVDKPPLLPGPVTAHAVEPSRPSTVYLADPTRVVVSADAGCTWKLVLEVPAAASTAIGSLTVPDTAEPTGRLLVVVTTQPLAATDAFGAVSVVHSRRGEGEPFRQSAPLSGRVRPAVAPGDPDVVYLGTSELGQVGAGPLRSTDGGATFVPTTGTRTHQLPSGPSPDSAPRLVVVDPASRDELLVGSGSLQRSTDGGANFSVALEQAQVQYAHALASHGRGGDSDGTVVVAAGANNTSGFRLDGDDPGQLWSVPREGEPRSLPVTPLRGVPQSLAAGRTSGELVLAIADLSPGLNDDYNGIGALWLLDEPRDTWVDVMDSRGHALLDAQVDRTDDPAVHLRSSSLANPPGADAYVVYSPPARGRIVPPTVDDGSGDTDRPADEEAFPPGPRACPDAPVFAAPTVSQSASRLSPAQASLPVDADGRASHEVTLDLAGDAAALDLVLLLDTSDSMGPAAAGIVCGLEELVTGLAEDGVDLQVGLAEFWDDAPGTRYRRLVDLGPPGRDVQRALRSVQTRGGEESHRSALVQTATGRGLSIGDQEVIAPGQRMSFRDDALRVVLHITDEPWTATTEGEPSPLEVIDVLNDENIRHVGLQVLQDDSLGSGSDRVDGLAGQALLRAQLDQFSSGTGARAPTGGVDCDGDGTTDLHEGDPLVCTGHARDGTVPELGAAVRALLDALAVRGDVTLQAEPESGATVQVGARYDDVDLRTASRYAFPLALRCTGTGPVEVELQARAGLVIVARAISVLLCPAAPADAALESAPSPPAPPPAPPGQAGIAAVPPAGPPPVVQVPAPAPAPAGATAGAAAAVGAAAGAGAGSGSAAAGAAGAAGVVGAGQSAGAGQGALAGLAAAPDETSPRAQVAVARADDVPLAAVPLGAALLTTAALAAHLVAGRRRPGRPATVDVRRRTP